VIIFCGIFESENLGQKTRVELLLRAQKENGTLTRQWGCFDPWRLLARSSVTPPLKLVIFDKITICLDDGK